MKPVLLATNAQLKDKVHNLTLSSPVCHGDSVGGVISKGIHEIRDGLKLLLTAHGSYPHLPVSLRVLLTIVQRYPKLERHIQHAPLLCIYIHVCRCVLVDDNKTYMYATCIYSYPCVQASFTYLMKGRGEGKTYIVHSYDHCQFLPIQSQGSSWQSSKMFNI